MANFEKLFPEYWRKVVADCENIFDKKAIARNAFIAGFEAAQHRVQADGACAFPGCDDLGWNGGFCKLHNPANAPRR